MLGELLEVGTKLSEVSDRLQQAGDAKRQRIANYFLSIEKCLQDSAEQLKSGTVPSSEWGELETYGWELPETIGKEIGAEKAKELARLLVRTASRTPTNADIQAIETAAGKFKALANTIITRQGGNSSTRRRIITYTAVGAAGLAGGSLLHWYFSQFGIKFPSIQPTTASLPLIQWTMPTFLGKSVAKTILWNAPDRICKRIEKMTNSRFIIKPDRNGETLDILTKVNNGSYKCGYSGIYYGDLYKALYFSCAIPFGLNPQEQNAWLYYKENPDDEETYVQSIYKKVGLENIISFPAGATGAQMGGWFKKRIESIEDLRNLTIRIPGLGGEIFKGFNVNVTTHSDLEKAGRGKYPLDVCIKQLKNGNFGAVEWIGPHDDTILKLHEAANFYHYPGWWEPGTTFDVQVNRVAWNGLPSEYQAIFKVACFETHMDMLAEYNQSNILALQQIPQNVQMVRFSNDILKTAEGVSTQLLNNYAKEPSFNEVYTKWRDFREQIAWINNVDSIRKTRS